MNPKIGTWSTTGLDIIQDDTVRTKVGQTGGITLLDKVTVDGKLGIGVKNFNDVDFAVAGSIKVQRSTIQWLDSLVQHQEIISVVI